MDQRSLLSLFRAVLAVLPCRASHADHHVAQVYASIKDADEDEDESLVQNYDGGCCTPARLTQSLIDAREAASERRRALGWK